MQIFSIASAAALESLLQVWARWRDYCSPKDARTDTDIYCAYLDPPDKLVLNAAPFPTLPHVAFVNFGSLLQQSQLQITVYI